MRRRRVIKLTSGVLAGLAGCSEESKQTETTDTRTSSTGTTLTENETDTATSTSKETTEEDSQSPRKRELPWTQLPGPPGGPVAGIAVSAADPDYIYAVCMTGGPYASTNAGQSWVQSREGLHHGTGVVASPHDPKVARNGAGRRTINAGRKWYSGEHSHKKLRGIRIDGGVADITYDYHKPGVLFAGTTNGFYRTFDSGLHWEQVNFDLSTDGVRINRVTSHRERDGLVGAVLPDNRVAVSSDRGDSWTNVDGTEEIPSGTWSRGIVFDHTRERAGYVQAGTGVYRFGDGTISEVTADVEPLRFLWYGDIHISADANRLYFVAKPTSADSWRNTNLYVYDASKDTVRQLDHPDYAASATAHPTDPETVYLGGGSWVYESTDAGDSWSALSNDFYDRYLAAVGVNPDNSGTLVPGSICSSGLWASQDHGQNYDWKRAGLRPFLSATGERHYEEHYVMRVAGGGNRMYATTAAGLLVSTDNGRTWRLSTNVPGYDTHSLDHYHGLAVDPNDSKRVFIGTGLGRHAETNEERGQRPSVDRTTRIWRSVDGAQSWTEVTNGLPSKTRTVIQDILVSHDNSSVIYAGTNANDYIAVGRGRRGGTGLGVFRSSSGGDRWHRLDTLFDNIHALGQDAVKPNLVYASTPIGVFRSTDAGTNWEQLFHHPSKALVAHPEVSGLLFAGVQKYDGYWDAFVSTDSGDTWAEANLTIQSGQTPSSREYDGIDYNADYASGGGDFMQFSLDAATGHLVVATRGAGLWRCDVESIIDDISTN